jgi:hypothetical protein
MFVADFLVWEVLTRDCFNDGDLAPSSNAHMWVMLVGHIPKYLAGVGGHGGIPRAQDLDKPRSCPGKTKTLR